MGGVEGEGWERERGEGWKGRGREGWEESYGGGEGERGGRRGDGRGGIFPLLPMIVGTVVLQPTCPYSSRYSGPPAHLSVLQ